MYNSIFYTSDINSTTEMMWLKLE